MAGLGHGNAKDDFHVPLRRSINSRLEFESVSLCGEQSRRENNVSRRGISTRTRKRLEKIK